MPNSISFKKEKLNSWQSSGILPKREIEFLSADFNTEYEKTLKKQLKKITKDKKIFILLEGVLFFINRDDTNKLFSLFSDIQRNGEYVGSVSFQKAIEEKPAFKKLERFTEERLDFNEKFCYQTVEDSYYESLDDYQLIEHQDTITLNNKYGGKELNSEELLDEHMYILKRK
jgi:O-methyltransferase involved in polyketide biosynthesis